MKLKKPCPNCNSNEFVKAGSYRLANGTQVKRFKCTKCNKKVQEDYDTTEKTGLTKNEIRQRYANRFRIQKAARLLKRDEIVSENEFINLCDFAPGTQYRSYMAEEEFKQYKGRAGGVTYWGHPDDIDELKKEFTLK